LHFPLKYPVTEKLTVYQQDHNFFTAPNRMAVLRKLKGLGVQNIISIYPKHGYAMWGITPPGRAFCRQNNIEITYLENPEGKGLPGTNASLNAYFNKAAEMALELAMHNKKVAVCCYAGETSRTDIRDRYFKFKERLLMGNAARAASKARPKRGGRKWLRTQKRL